MGGSRSVHYNKTVNGDNTQKTNDLQYWLMDGMKLKHIAGFCQEL